MGALIFLAFAFVIVLFANRVADKYFQSNQIFAYSLALFLMGVLCIVGSAYFDLPVVSLRYGVVPEIAGPDAGVFIGKFLTASSLVGFIVFCVSRFSKNK